MLNINYDSIRIDPEGYWNFGSDQANVNYPVRFPTVMIALESTFELDRPVDAMRVEAGHLPMFPWMDLGIDDYDDDGWYNFYIGLNGFTDTMVDNCITAIVQSRNADDDECEYDIPLTEAEQNEIYKVVDAQLCERFDTSCDELLEEARQEMIRMEEYRAKHPEF